MAAEFTTSRRVEFAETDMAGIAHFSNFFRWMESAEHEFVRSLGCSVHGEMEGLRYGFARAHASCDYARAVVYEDVLDIHLRVTAKSAKAFTYVFRFLRGDEEIATGRMEVVCVSKVPGEKRIRAVDMPVGLAGAIEVAASPAAAPASDVDRAK